MDRVEKNKGVYFIVHDWIDEYVYYPSKSGNAIVHFSSANKKIERRRGVPYINSSKR